MSTLFDRLNEIITDTLDVDAPPSNLRGFLVGEEIERVANTQDPSLQEPVTPDPDPVPGPSDVSGTIFDNATDPATPGGEIVLDPITAEVAASPANKLIPFLLAGGLLIFFTTRNR